MAELEITLQIMLPIFLMLVLGWLLHHIGWMTDEVTRSLNRLIFRLFLPVLLMNNIRSLDADIHLDVSFAAFILLGVGGVFALCMLLVPRFVDDPRKRGVMVQGIFRTNFAVLGIPLMEAMFGEPGVVMVSLALPLVIPLNNVLAVVALSAPGEEKPKPLQLLKSIIANPLIIFCVIGAVLLLCRIPLPDAIDRVCTQLGSLASPLSLLVLGASLRWQGLHDNRKELCWTVVLKQAVMPLVMVGLAVALGFRNEALGVMMILFGAPCAISSFPMAEAMGGDGSLAAGQVVLTTIFSMGTLFVLIYVGKLMGWI